MTTAIDPLVKDALQPKEMRKSIETFLGYAEHMFDVNADVQRGEVWTTRKRIDSIDSVIRGISINAIHVVKKDSGDHCDERWVIDGRQRLETFRKFFAGEFTVYLVTTEGEKRVSYAKIKKLAEGGDKNCKRFVDRFRAYDIVMNDYDPMRIEDQEKLFLKLNNGEPMSKNHLRYAQNRELKKLLRGLWGEMFATKDIIRMPQKLIRAKKSENLSLLHRFLRLWCGDHMDEEFQMRDICGGILDSSAKTMNEELECQKSAETEKRRQKRLMDLKICVKMFNEICEYNPALKNTAEGWLFDCIVFLMYGMSEGVVTLAMVREFGKIFWEKIFNEHEKWRNDRGENGGWRWREGSNRTASIQKRLDHVKELFQASGLDTGEKNTPATASQMREALFDADLTDPITGKPVNADNVHVDHVLPKSKFSNTTFVAMEKSSNLGKSNISPEQARKLSGIQTEKV